MPMRNPCSASSRFVASRAGFGGIIGVQIGSMEISVAHAMTRANARKFAAAFSGLPVLSPAV